MNRLLISEALEHADQVEQTHRDATEGTPLANVPSKTARIIRALAAALQVDSAPQPDFNLYDHLVRQREFSANTFGPGLRTAGVTEHIRKELDEIAAKPADVAEWIDVVILGLDGAWRTGASPQQIIDALAAKQAKNEARTWPDWRAADPNQAIEHVRGEGA